uniref:Uncharacterized protein n=1 Tax=Arundo donax TaxID=35708 RepID=A0A0A8ZRP4_ARUDO
MDGPAALLAGGVAAGEE